MASVKQCDRCGTIIKKSMINVESEGEWWRYSIKKDAFPYPQIDNVDLCDDCLHSLYNWLMKGEKRN